MASGKYKDIHVGIRINPQVGLGTIKEMSTSGDHSKFGVGYNDYKEEIYKVYYDRPWMNGIHVHVGSQGNDQLVKPFSKIHQDAIAS